MSGPRLVTKATLATPEAVARAFCLSARALVPRLANAELVAVMMAHSASETGNWRAMRNFNFGNVKATDGWINGGGPFVYYEASENLPTNWKDAMLKLAKPRTDGKPGLDMEVRGKRSDGRYTCWFWPDHIQARFRGFEHFEDGAASYMRKLTGRYLPALTPAAAGDPAGYVNSIHSLSYFTAGLEGYRALLIDRYKRYLPDATAAWQSTSAPEPDAMARIDLVPDDSTITVSTTGECRLSPTKAYELADELMRQAEALYDSERARLEPWSLERLTE